MPARWFPALPEAIGEARPPSSRRAALSRLDDPAELALMRRIALYPRLVEAAALSHEAS